MKQRISRLQKAENKLRRRVRLITLLTVTIPTIGFITGIIILLEKGMSILVIEVGIAFYILTMVGVGVGFHRLLSHNSFKTFPVIRNGLIILGSMAGQGPVFYWVAIHRFHHENSDGLLDPHSPNTNYQNSKIKGLWHAQVGWMFGQISVDWGRYLPDLVKMKTIITLNRAYLFWVVIGLILPALICFSLTGKIKDFIDGFLIAGLGRMFLAHHHTWSINSICHMFGRVAFNTNDSSRNNLILSLPSLGESWHNNHHAFPSAASHGLYWWQIDINGLVIMLLKTLNLAWGVRKPSKQAIIRKKII